jgi:hypothetical protein
MNREVLARTLCLRLIPFSLLLCCVTAPAVADLPAEWLAAWQAPPAADRPLQIVHGIPARRASVEGMRYYQERGLGGIVCNVDFRDYMQSDDHWKTLVAGVEACQELGLVVWLYDEKGYPSGAAGGMVLARNPAYEAQALCFDPDRPEPFVIRPAYEHTHASNNYHAARRYVDLLDEKAVACFLDVTHEAYWKRLEPHFGTTIEAIFTDEPSLMAVNIGQLPESVRDRVRIQDPIDPNVQPLPSVPWNADLPKQYKARYGEDLLGHRESLFNGDTPKDRQVRRQFWALVSDLVADRYYGQIHTWCRAHRIASTGHKLHEESILHHVPLDGNGLKVLGRMDIPGLDMLSSNPEVVIHSGWMTAAVPNSAALLQGRRRVMTEVSDFSQRMGGDGPVDLAAMQATAAWQAAWGVTDFTLYYRPDDRSVEDYRAYCEFVGRLNAVLKPARRAPRVLLYYPIYDLWAEYRPVAERLSLASQSDRARQIVSSFMRLGQTLQRRQIPFCLVDHETLAGADLKADGNLNLAGQDFSALVLPACIELPEPVSGVVERFRQASGQVLSDSDTTPLSAASLDDKFKADYRFVPPSDRITLGRFVRSAHTVLLVVNVGNRPYEGRLAVSETANWHRLDPATGTIDEVGVVPADGLPISLAARQTFLFVRAP